jgi:hypothetical protein
VPRPFIQPCLLAAFGAVVLAHSSSAVILYATGDPAANTTAPDGTLAESGWQYEGDFGNFLGTPIASQFFITAKHIGQAGGVFTFGSVNYSLARQFPDPQSDLAIWQVNGVLPLTAPLYSRGDEVGKQLVVIGRGTERGAEVYRDGTLRGWSWGHGTAVRRWGENVIAAAFTNTNPSDPLIAARFDANGLANEAHLSAGDSGGAVFVHDGTTWKLAGINYAVDPPVYSEPNPEKAVTAAFFDVRGYYRRDSQGNFSLITSTEPVPRSFYATRISAKLDWIYSVTEPTADRDGDGIPNLLEYAFRLDPDAPNATGLPEFSLVNGAPTLVYRRVTTATDIQYAIEQSTNLQSWQPVDAQEERVALQGNVETVRATLPPPASGPLFLRVAVTRP